MTVRVLTWHVHGSYLYAMALAAQHGGYELYAPVRPDRPEGYGGRGGNFDWPSSLVEVPAEQVGDLELDVVLTQSLRNWQVDRAELLTPAQRALPAVHLEHDPPREHPTDTRHPAADAVTLLVHVTHFNALMWDNGSTPVAVVEHAAPEPGRSWTGEHPRGLVVVNGLASRGRRLGLDVFEEVRGRVPLDLVGLGSQALSGLGDVPQRDLPALAAQYRFFFHPIRYTSLGLAVIEALHLGMPVVGLATTELAAVLRDGETGFCDTDVDRLVDVMHRLLDDHELARRIGAAGKELAERRFGLQRFGTDWGAVLAGATR